MCTILLPLILLMHDPEIDESGADWQSVHVRARRRVGPQNSMAAAGRRRRDRAPRGRGTVRRPRLLMAAAPVVSLLMAAAPLLLRPETFGCVPDGRTLCTAGIRKAIASCPTAGCVVDFAGPGTYLTQPFNLTSNLELRIGPNATILGTSEDRYNLNSDWPILPWAEYPSLPTRNTNPSFQAVIRGYNLTNVSIVAQPGGMLDCGGTYWICQAFGDAKKAAGFCGDPSTPGPYCLHPPCNASCGGAVGHKPGPCPPGTPTRPRCVHLIGTDHIRVTNLTMRNSPFWNLHFQFSSDVIVDGVQIYQFPGAANADGIDIDSTRDVVVKNTMVDSNDDMLCVKSGANWLGRQAGVPSENIIFQDCEIRSVRLPPCLLLPSLLPSLTLHLCRPAALPLQYCSRLDLAERH
jgi:polygalacturonase